MGNNEKAVIQIYEVETKNGGELESYIDEGLCDMDVVCAWSSFESKRRVNKWTIMQKVLNN